MRGSGKTTLGQRLAEKLGKHFIDLDHEIEKHEKMPISEIIKTRDWPYFRKIEQKICANISKMDNLVIATGGGIILNKKNIQNLKKNGIIFFIQCDIEILKKRLEKSNKRPSLKKGKNFLEELNEIWEERENFYLSSADFIIENNDNINKNIKKIISKLNSF